MTLIDKAEAHDDDMIRRVAAALWKAETVDAGVPQSVTDARTPEAFAEQSDYTRTKWEKLARAAIAALPARGVGADAVLDAAHSYLMEQYGSSPLGHPADRARILAALAPTDAERVNETPKSEHDAGNVLAAAARAREAVAWQSTTEAFIPFITDERYRGFSPEVQKHYIPYRCPSCVDAAQAREAALKKAAQLAYEVWDDPEALAKAILALIGEERT